MPRTPYRASEGKRSQSPTMPYPPTLTSSSVHHSSHQLTTTFLRITLKRPFVPNSDVKQRFTTTANIARQLDHRIRKQNVRF